MQSLLASACSKVHDDLLAAALCDTVSDNWASVKCEEGKPPHDIT